MPSPENKVRRTATEVGVEVGNKTGAKLSAIATNKRIADAGWQIRHPSGDGWIPTPLGEANGGILIDCGKSHGNGKPVQMLVWLGDEVVEMVCRAMASTGQAA